MAERIVESLDDGRITLVHKEVIGALPRRPRCAEVMQRRLLSVRPQDSIQQAAYKMRIANVGFLPVCDDARRVVGTITDRDITIRAVALDRDPRDCLVEDVMSVDVVTCRPDDDLDLAERFMAQYQKSRLVITDEQAHLQGVVSLADLALKDSPASVANLLAAIALREAARPEEPQEGTKERERP